MKVKFAKNSFNRMSDTGFAPPPIPFERAAVKDMEKDQYLSLKLKSIPGRTTSSEYTLNVRYFQSGTAEEWIKFTQNLNHVFVGQSLSTRPNKFSMTRRLLVGDSLSHFDKKASTLLDDEGNPDESLENYKLTMRVVTETIFNKKALLTQKRYMRRILRKPKDISTSAYCTGLSELNKYLEG